MIKYISKILQGANLVEKRDVTVHLDVIGLDLSKSVNRLTNINKSWFFDSVFIIKPLVILILRIINRRQEKLMCVYRKYRVPWSSGYHIYKQREIDSRIVEMLERTTDDNPFGHGLDERIVEIPWAVQKTKGSQNVLDAGSALNHEYVLKHLADSKVTIVTLYPELYRHEEGVSYVYDDLRCMPFKNDLFDAIVSISTLEHIGLDTDGYKLELSLKNNAFGDGCYLAAVLEMKRVLKDGGQLLLSAPFGRHKVYKKQWQLFDSDMVKELIKTFNPKSFELLYFCYSEGRWKVSTAEDCVDLEYRGSNSPGAASVFLLQLIK